MPTRSLVLGLDGADLDLIRELGADRLPNLHTIMGRGVYAHLESVQPPATLPNWTTFLTGQDPGRHGVFDFTTRHGYQVRFTAGTVRESPTIMRRLDALGLACCCVGFPATWPPEQLSRGIFMSGWDAPVAFEADRSFVWPPRLFDSLVERFGTPRFDDVDEFDTERPGWHRRLPSALTARIERKVELARWLLEGRAWDLFALYFGESDTAAHHLWSLHDPSSPRHPAGGTSDPDGLAEVYEAIDAAVGSVLDAAGGDDVEITLLSDHGSGGSSDKVLYLNRALAASGFLEFHREGSAPALIGLAKEIALTRFPPKLRETLFRAGGAFLPSWLESRARFGAIDMRKTAAFSDELNYFPAIHLNVKGRDPEGTIEASAIGDVIRDIERELCALRDPWSDRPVVHAIHRREELFEGPYVCRAPDLLVELELDEGYSYNLMPSSTGPDDGSMWRLLPPGEYLGRKGRSLPGSHRPRGFFAAAGPQVATVGEIDAHIADVTATLLSRLGVSVGADMSGRVLFEALAETADAELLDLPDAPRDRESEGADPSKVEARLRALGYID